ncbi:MAG: cytochrome b/b6 domain-containing protein [Ignavibacteriae bacterium]|nr:MAG: cytochrome b/b6 domain-containing protein [Ignavibacteriota bacterium]
MEEETKIKDKINEEVNKRLQKKLSELELQIREEVSHEYEELLEKEKNESDIIETPVEKKDDPKNEDKAEVFTRFGWNFRFQHILLLSSTVMLILTGIPLKFPKSDFFQFIINWFGGPPGARAVHHLFALVMIFVGVYHLIYSFWSRAGRKDFYELLPSLRDFSDVINQLKYYLGIRKEKVKYGRFSYVEKFDYWAVYWGLIMMIGTGTIMWLFQGKFEPVWIGEINLSFGPDMVTNYVHAIAREMHSDEALLATLVIIGWHFYNVHLNPHKFPMSKVWLNGKVTKKEMLDEHPLEYEEIMKQRAAEKDEENEKV